MSRLRQAISFVQKPFEMEEFLSNVYAVIQSPSHADGAPTGQ